MDVYKKIFSLISVCLRECFLVFCSSIHKIVDSMDIYKSLDISNGTVMKNPEMLKFISDHLKTKNMCKHAVENYVIY